MKKLKFVQSISGYGSVTRSGDDRFAFVPGDIADIEDELAAAWVASGIAEFVPKDKPVAEKAVAKKPETPEAPKVEAPTVETKEDK